MIPTDSWHEEQEAKAQQEDIAFDSWLGSIKPADVIDWCAHGAETEAKFILEWYLDDCLQGKLLPREINDLFGSILQKMFKQETEND